MNNYLQEEQIKIKKPTQRLIFGIIVGIIFNAYIYAAIDRGVYLYYYPSGAPRSNIIFWDDWLLRIIAIVISSGAGSIIAGLIARRKGKLIGFLSVIPSMLFWVYCLYCLQNNQLNLNIFVGNVMPASTSVLLLLLAILINGAVGYTGGWFGELLSPSAPYRFDNRKFSLLGIKWYNYIWYPLVMYIILIEGFIIASYGYETVKILFQLDKFSLSSMLINAISAPAFVGLVLLYFSVTGSYQILIDNSGFVKTTKGKIILLGLLIIIVPLVSFGLTNLSLYLESMYR